MTLQMLALSCILPSRINERISWDVRAQSSIQAHLRRSAQVTPHVRRGTFPATIGPLRIPSYQIRPHLLISSSSNLAPLDIYITMSGRIVKEVVNGAKRVSTIPAEEVQDRGFKRVIDAIDLALVAETAEKVANVFSGPKLMNANQEARADKIIITSEIAQSEK